MTNRIISFTLGVAVACSLSSAIAADLGAYPPPPPAVDPLQPVVAIVTLPFTAAGEVLTALTPPPPPPPPIVAKY